jgi:hypothetical protein
MSNDLSSLKATTTPTTRDSQSLREIEERYSPLGLRENLHSHFDLSSSLPPRSPPRNHSNRRENEFQDILFEKNSNETHRGHDHSGQSSSPSKWTLSQQGDSPLVRNGNSDAPKPMKRQSPSSYGVSPPNDSSPRSSLFLFLFLILFFFPLVAPTPVVFASAVIVNAILASKPSLGIIEVEEYSTEEDEDDADLYSDYSRTPPHEDSDPNIEAVVQSFLSVVGKCSEITHQVGSKFLFRSVAHHTLLLL